MTGGPKLLMIIGDTAAGIGILGSVFHVLPAFIAALASTAAAIWYGILIYDRIIGKVKNDGH